MSAPAL